MVIWFPVRQTRTVRERSRSRSSMRAPNSLTPQMERALEDRVRRVRRLGARNQAAANVALEIVDKVLKSLGA